MQRLSETTTQNLVNSAWALDTLSCLDPEALKEVVERFLNMCDSCLGVEWITLGAVVERNGLSSTLQDFKQKFNERVLMPALMHLRSLRTSSADAELSEKLQHFQRWIVEIQLPSLGAFHTREALCAVGAASHGQGKASHSWLSRARRAVLQAAWWSCPHAAVSSQGVVAWLAADLKVPGGNSVFEPGRVFAADDSAEHSILVERMVLPIFLQVPRNGHAERRALIHLLRQVSRAFSYNNHDQWQETLGSVQLYASHFLCISCLAAVAQFNRRLPRVAVHVEYGDAWVDWEEREPPPHAETTRGDVDNAAPVLTIGRAV